MAAQDHPLSVRATLLTRRDSPHAHIGRRRFLVASGLSATGLLLFPLNTMYASPIFGAVAKLANATGCDVADSNVEDYLKRAGIPKNTDLEVRQVNAAIKRQGFSDLLQSPVYVPRKEDTYFFYPVRHEDRFNAVVNFFDGKREHAPQFICSLDGPTLFGIGELAAVVAWKNSNEVSRQTLLPRANIRMDGKRLNKSYDRPNIYSTDAGIVEVIYKNTGKGKGLVTVEAKDGRGTVLARGDYELAYSDKEPRGPKM